MSPEIRNHFRQFFWGEETSDNFTQWLYGYQELENIIGKQHYLSLIEIDYRQKSECYKAKQILQQLYEQNQPGQLLIDQAISIAENMLSGLLPLDEGCQKLTNLIVDSPDLVNSVFIAYADEFDRLGSTDFYNGRIMRDVEKLLSQLQSHGRQICPSTSSS